MPDSHANFAYSLVATAPSPASSGTSLVVTAGQGALFPAVPFNATIWPTASAPLSTNAEIVRVTARATDTLTITRAQEGSSARTVIVGDQIAATVTAKTFTDIEVGTPQIGSITPNTDPSFPTGNYPSTPGTVMNIARNATLANTVVLVSQRLQLMYCPVWPGLQVNGITFASANTAGSGMTHQWFCLVDPATLAPLRFTSDDTSTAWAANSLKSLALTSQYTIPAGIFGVYVGICVQGTVPSLYAVTTNASAPIHQLAPLLSAGSTTGLTDPASCPNPVAQTTGGSIAWCMLS